MARKQLPKALEVEVLVQSRRRCCICFGLQRDVQVKRGQIAHLDKNSSNNDLENLAFLCFEHHDQYDSSTSQSKNFTRAEVAHYRDELHCGLAPLLDQHLDTNLVAQASMLGGLDEYERQLVIEQQQALLERLAASPGPLVVLRAARELGMSASMVDRHLFELTRVGLVRSDRRDASTQKVYSLSASTENRLIDAFVESLKTRIVVDSRYLRRRDVMIDALIQDGQGNAYLVETLQAPDAVTRKAVEARIKSLTRYRREAGVDNAQLVLLIGVSGHTVLEGIDLLALERQGILVRYFELNASA